VVAPRLSSLVNCVVFPVQGTAVLAVQPWSIKPLDLNWLETATAPSNPLMRVT
jgi:hypothetical protein